MDVSSATRYVKKQLKKEKESLLHFTLIVNNYVGMMWDKPQIRIKWDKRSLRSVPIEYQKRVEQRIVLLFNQYCAEKLSERLIAFQLALGAVKNQPIVKGF